MNAEIRQTSLFLVINQIRSTSKMVEAGEALPEALLTSAELSRSLGLDHDHVKKYLKSLKNWGLIRTIGANPKCYKFDPYSFRKLCQHEANNPEDLTLLLEQLLELGTD